MNLRKVKPEEIKIRKALLTDLQKQVKAAHVKAVGKHVGSMRKPAEKAAESEKVEAKEPVVEKKPKPKLTETDEVDVSDENEGDTAGEEDAAPVGKPSLSEMISRLSAGKSAK